jgi:hypothetical protein
MMADQDRLPDGQGGEVNPVGRLDLLFGPYKAPRLKVGQRAVCQYRDADVVITSRTDAPIPWPRCRSMEHAH